MSRAWFLSFGFVSHHEQYEKGLNVTEQGQANIGTAKPSSYTPLEI